MCWRTSRWAAGWLAGRRERWWWKCEIRCLPKMDTLQHERLVLVERLLEVVLAVADEVPVSQPGRWTRRRRCSRSPRSQSSSILVFCYCRSVLQDPLIQLAPRWECHGAGYPRSRGFGTGYPGWKVLGTGYPRSKGFGTGSFCKRQVEEHVAVGIVGLEGVGSSRNRNRSLNVTLFCLLIRVDLE